MNSDSFRAIGSSFPSGNPFNVANILSSIGLTETAFSFTNGGAVASISIPQMTDIRGSETSLDPTVTTALLANQFGKAGLYRNQNAPYFTINSFDGRAFRVRAVGKASFTAGGAGATTFAVNLYQGTSATLASDVKLAGPTALSVNANKVANINFIVEATCMWDVTSGIIFGEFWASISGNVDVGGANTKSSQYTSRTGLGPSGNGVAAAAASNLVFIPSVAFGTTAPVTPGGTVNLVEMSLEQI